MKINETVKKQSRFRNEGDVWNLENIFNYKKKKGNISSLNYSPFYAELLRNFFAKPKITRYIGVPFKSLRIAASYPYRSISKIANSNLEVIHDRLH